MLLRLGSVSSRLVILKEETEVDPGWVEIMPRKRVTPHVRTWLSAHTDTKNFSDNFTLVTGDLKKLEKDSCLQSPDKPKLVQNARMLDLIV